MDGAKASKAAVSGYDPVAFFTDSRPVNGSPFISATYQGADYFFATEEHKALFENRAGAGRATAIDRCAGT